MKVTIGIPYYLTVTAETMYAVLAGLLSLGEDVRPSVSMVGGGCIDENRERIIDEALAQGSTRLLFIDSDITFAYDAMTRILQHAHPIIGGTYNYKRLPLQSVAQQLEDPNSQQPTRCAVLPSGFMSLHLPTLVKILPRPWFWYDHQQGKVVGEDVMFCRNARRAGLELWCDPTIQLGHVGTYVY